eukprot:TRINITY_DN143503_c0_g1_i1.p1 TRINITY_DN143503_c0_g1~~TRINITY_DN143503_c0_g1_i1.p1  ORF type:complete len:461 (+),score=77.02 TRINITY_DN143503_c0_g1_i1:144-1526(+)
MMKSEKEIVLDRKKKGPNMFLILGLFSLLLIILATENLTYAINGRKYMKQYRTYLNVLVNVLFVVVFWIGLIAAKCFSRKRPILISKWLAGRFLLIAMIDACATYLTILPSDHVSAPLKSMLQQIQIPFTLLLSFFWLGKSYKISHYAAAVTIILGGIASAWNTSADNHDDPRFPGNSSMGMVALFICSTFFTSLSAVMKEKVIHNGKHPVDLWSLNTWIATFQLPIVLIMSPLAFTMQDVNDPPRVSELMTNFHDATKCVFAPGMAGVPTDCAVAWRPVLIYFMALAAANIVAVILVKEGSALLYFFAWAGSIIVTTLCCSTFAKWLPSEVHVSFSAMDIVGLVFVVFGLILFSVKSEGKSTSGDNFDGDEDMVNGQADMYVLMQDHESSESENGGGLSDNNDDENGMVIGQANPTDFDFFGSDSRRSSTLSMMSLSSMGNDNDDTESSGSMVSIESLI